MTYIVESANLNRFLNITITFINNPHFSWSNMAKLKKKVVKTADKWKKKKWFTIVAPKTFQERVIGETPSNNPELLIGRRIKANLMSLTGDIKRQNINIVFEINAVKGDRAETHVQSFELVNAAIKRKVRRGKDRLDHSFTCETKDNKRIRIKPLLITLNKTSNSVQTAINKSAVFNIKKLVKTLDYETVVADLVSYRFQKALKNVLHKIYPVQLADIKIMSLLGQANNQEAEKVSEENEERPEIEVSPENPKEAKKKGKAEAEIEEAEPEQSETAEA